MTKIRVKRIKGSPGPIDETATQVKHTFKFNNNDLPQDVDQEPNGLPV